MKECLRKRKIELSWINMFLRRMWYETISAQNQVAKRIPLPPEVEFFKTHNSPPQVSKYENSDENQPYGPSTNV